MDIRQALKDYRGLSVLKKQTELEMKELAEQVQAYMIDGCTDHIEFDDVRCTWKECETTRVNSKELREQLPDVFAAFSSVTVSRRFLVH